MDNRADVQAPSPGRIPGDWSREKDQAWYKEHFESSTEDPNGEAVERLWYERRRLDRSLTEWVGIFRAGEEFDPDPITECLGADAKAVLLLQILQAQAPQQSLASRFEKDLTRAKSALAACDEVASRYLLQRGKVWLFELGTVAEQLAYSRLQLKDAVRGNHEYKLRWAAQMDQVTL
jgi:hypothetical protein